MSRSPSIADLLKGSCTELLDAYRARLVTPEEVIDHIVEASLAISDNPIWITAPDKARLTSLLHNLRQADPESLPLWGIPFAVKDNIDVAGMPTTAACPEFSYHPEKSAFVVQSLVDAGAIPVGKTNLDQFATGLVGIRSPYGTPVNPDHPDLVPGGSSSGSAIAIACGLASFALGTDTAGSGRIPAGFNRLTGFKLSKGLVSTTGVVPACRSLDCVTLFTRNTKDAALIAEIACTFDASDPFARPNSPDNAIAAYGRWATPLTLAVIAPDQLKFFGDASYAKAYAATIQRLEQAGVVCKSIDFRPFSDAAKQLYSGPWIAERYVAIADVLEQSPDAVLSVTRSIISGGKDQKATQVYESIYELAALRRACLSTFTDCDALLTPTAGKHFSIAELDADPTSHNQALGHYTNYMNLLDMCGLAMPGLDTDSGKPFGITLVGDRFHDTRLLAIGAFLEDKLQIKSGLSNEPNLTTVPPFKDPAVVHIAVCGAHMSGLPLNHQLTSRGAVFVQATKTSPHYRLFALAGGPPMRPGMLRDNDGGKRIELEIWSVPAAAFASFVSLIPSPLGIGSVETASGEMVLGFVCEQSGLVGATQITEFGGWRDFLLSQRD